MSESSEEAAPPERPKRGRPKKPPEPPFYPELPQPTGEQVRELRLRMGWTLSYTAGILGLTDAQAVSDIERMSERKGSPRMLNLRSWTLMLLAAGEHPTFVLVERQSSTETPD
ncbi:helix-turn-helix domain-containing protein [Azohydromonas aeria]|uniref:helix-turn-helix domain-containing protein n=1 Tax=Azohydromonas aeria TaxID=2590212 RepID=UPI0012FCE491|nr:helix-turn-helix transcriptional regulator [Azohydromonas aeria]